MYERLKMLRNVFVCLRSQGTGLTKSVSNSCHPQKLGEYAEHTLTSTCRPVLLANSCWSNACTDHIHPQTCTHTVGFWSLWVYLEPFIVECLSVHLHACSVYFPDQSYLKLDDLGDCEKDQAVLREGFSHAFAGMLQDLYVFIFILRMIWLYPYDVLKWSFTVVDVNKLRYRQS